VGISQETRHPREIVRGVIAAIVAATVLGTTLAIVEGTVYGAVILAVGVLVILIPLLAFPDVANLDLRSRRTVRPGERRLLAAAIVPGLVIAVIGVIVGSVEVVLMGAGLIAFFLVLLLVARLRGLGR
jgi:hypothetical protein